MKALNIFPKNLFHIIFFMFKCKKKITPPIFHNLLMPKLENNYNIRKLTEPFYRKKSAHCKILVHIYRMNPLMIIFVRYIQCQYSVRKSENLYWCFMIQNNTSNFSNFNYPITCLLFRFTLFYPPKISLFHCVWKESSWVSSELNSSFEFDTKINAGSRW